MDNHLDQYITSEIFKQFKALTRSGQRTFPRRRHPDPASKTVLWSGTARDRDGNFLDIKHGGLQIVAARLVKDLKKVMQSK